MAALQDVQGFLLSNPRPSQLITNIINEVLAVAAKVDVWVAIPTSGNAVARYNATTLVADHYEIRYQEGNVGNIVHELIHACVNESYDNDFINYFCTLILVDIPEKKLSDRGYCKSEEARQAIYYRAGGAKLASINAKLVNLQSWARLANELTAEQKKQIEDKLLYSTLRPHIEYDTCITQILVWLCEWGFPVQGYKGNKPVVNALCEELEKDVSQAYNARVYAKFATLNDRAQQAAKARRDKAMASLQKK